MFVLHSRSLKRSGDPHPVSHCAPIGNLGRLATGSPSHCLKSDWSALIVTDRRFSQGLAEVLMRELPLFQTSCSKSNRFGDCQVNRLIKKRSARDLYLFLSSSTSTPAAPKLQSQPLLGGLFLCISCSQLPCDICSKSYDRPRGLNIDPAISRDVMGV